MQFDAESFRTESEKRVWRHCVTAFSGGRRRVAAWVVYFTTAPCRAATQHTAASVPAPALRRPPQVRLPPDSIGPFRRRQNGSQTLGDTPNPLKNIAEKTFSCTFPGLSWNQYDGDCQASFFLALHSERQTGGGARRVEQLWSPFTSLRGRTTFGLFSWVT